MEGLLLISGQSLVRTCLDSLSCQIVEPRQARSENFDRARLPILILGLLDQEGVAVSDVGPDGQIVTRLEVGEIDIFAPAAFRLEREVANFVSIVRLANALMDAQIFCETLLARDLAVERLLVEVIALGELKARIADLLRHDNGLAEEILEFARRLTLLATFAGLPSTSAALSLLPGGHDLLAFYLLLDIKCLGNWSTLLLLSVLVGPLAA